MRMLILLVVLIAGFAHGYDKGAWGSGFELDKAAITSRVDDVYINTSGDTMTGTLKLAGTQTDSDAAATVGYANALAAVLNPNLGTNYASVVFDTQTQTVDVAFEDYAQLYPQESWVSLFVWDVLGREIDETLDWWVYHGAPDGNMAWFADDAVVIAHDLTAGANVPGSNYFPQATWYVADSSSWTVGDRAVVFSTAHTNALTDFAFGTVYAIPNATTLVFTASLPTNSLPTPKVDVLARVINTSPSRVLLDSGTLRTKAEYSTAGTNTMRATIYVRY